MSPWILASRPKTLPAAIVPVLLGSALAFRDGGFSPVPAFLCLAFAVLIQIGTNYANDLQDFLKGVDTAERIGPTRAVAAGMVTPQAMKKATILVFVAAFVVGSCLIYYGGPWLLAIGVASILCGLAYTGGPLPLGYNGLGDIFVFVFFGIVAVTFTYYVQTGYFSPAAFVLAIAPGALSTAILVVNNYRDEPTDKKTGKRTLAVLFGRRFAKLQYILLLDVAFLVPIGLAFFWDFSYWVLTPLILLPLALKLPWQLQRAQTAEEFGKVLARTAALMIAYGIIASFAVAIS